VTKRSRLPTATAEQLRLADDRTRRTNWKRWGPYLSERQWGTVREDYSADGSAWSYFPHEHARSRAYRWGEDGLLGFTDRQCRVCFSVALWNEKDPILKERLFGLTNPEGNHGEDAKEAWFYLDSTPTHSYMKSLYKYPQAEFPYARLVEENARRGKNEREFEIEDAGVFDESRYFDVFSEVAKAGEEDLLIRLTVANRGPDAARIHVLPTLWFRNTWSWGSTHDACAIPPRLSLRGDGVVVARHPELGQYLFASADAPRDTLFTENETNVPRLFGAVGASPWFKDAFHAAVVDGRDDLVRPDGTGTKCARHHVLDVPAGGRAVLRLRFVAVREAPADLFGSAFDEVVALRRREADEFYDSVLSPELDDAERAVARQAYAGLCHAKQFYHYVVEDWLTGDPDQPAPPASRRRGRNYDWRHLDNHDVILVPDKWEYPWYAVWDLAFHAVAVAAIDLEFAKAQLSLFLREWYMHPNGKLPSYEWAFSDANPPVHAWAVRRVYRLSGAKGGRDMRFLRSSFHKLLLNFTWWVNRTDVAGRQLFGGGFLGLDNVGVFDRSKPLPSGVSMAQADGTAWMAFYAATMLAIALELAKADDVYEEMASKFFEHFVAIADTMNHLGGEGLWDEADGFYYDKLRVEGRVVPLRVRSIVGLVPLLASISIESADLERFPGFGKRTRWFIENRRASALHRSTFETSPDGKRLLLALPSRERLERLLVRLFDETEFLSPHGVRSLSRHHADHPFELDLAGRHVLRYEPCESSNELFGGNSNWRGPVWFPLNHLIVEALQRYHRFYGDTLTVELPTGSGRRVDLGTAAAEIDRRLVSLFLPGADGRRPCVRQDDRFANDPHWKDLVLFHEYFHGDDGRGLGASHQTGWTSLVASSLDALAKRRSS
jgi:hypothetical protein